MATTLAKREPRIRSLFRNRPLAVLRDEMQDLISNVFAEEDEPWPFGRILPSLDMSETDGAVEVRMDIPGIEAKDVDIQVSGNLLTISGERKEDREEKGRTWHRVERRAGSFSRSVMLPCAVKEDAVDAEYCGGVLTVKLPKAEEAKAHKIKVKG